MGSFFTLNVDLDALTDAMFAFVTDPSPSRNERPVVEELGEINHDLIDVLECMVLDGTEERADISAFVQAIFGENGPGPRKNES